MPETMRRRDPEAVRRALEPWLALHLADADARIVEIERPSGGGLSNETLLLGVDCSGARHELVVQAAPVGEALFPVYDIATVFRLQLELGRRTEVPVPHVRWLESDPEVLGAQFYVMDRVHARVPLEQPPYHAAGWLWEAAPEVQARLWRSGLEGIASLHAIDVSQPGFQFLIEAPWGMALSADPAARRVEQWREFLEWTSDDAPRALFDALDELHRTRPEPPADLVIHWGDAKPTNCMFAGSELVAILDWELCGLGAREEDVAHWLMIDWLLSHMHGIERLPGFPGMAGTIEHYESLTGLQSTAYLWWFKFALARVGTHAHRMLVQRRRFGELPQDADLRAANPLIDLLLETMEWTHLPDDRA